VATPNGTDPPKPTPNGTKPPGAAWIQGVCVIGVVSLGIADLFTAETVVPWQVYAVLLTIAGGPEALKFWPGVK